MFDAAKFNRYDRLFCVDYKSIYQWLKKEFSSQLSWQSVPIVNLLRNHCMKFKWTVLWIPRDLISLAHDITSSARTNCCNYTARSLNTVTSLLAPY